MTAGGWIGAAAAGIGGGLAISGAAIGMRTRRLEREGHRVPGTIVAIEQDHAVRHTGPMHVAVFEFVALDGTRVRKRSSVSSLHPTHAIGDVVMVWHDPADPDRADIVGDSRWLAPSMIAMGLIFVAVGIGIVVLARQ
jgi:hypothetical protein